jgi:hypothetical protein
MIHVIITKIIKILSLFQCKILYYLSHILGGIYHPGFTVVFICFGTIHVCCYFQFLCIITCLGLHSLVTAHNLWLSWTTSVFSSTVTDLVLIHESVTSSDSVVHWLTLHSWTLFMNADFCMTDCSSTNTSYNWLTADLHDWRLSYECLQYDYLLLMNYVSFHNPVQTENRTLPWMVRLL